MGCNDPGVLGCTQHHCTSAVAPQHAVAAVVPVGDAARVERLQEAQLRTRQAQEQADLAESAHARTEQAWQTGAASRLDVDTALQSWLAARLQVAVAEVDVQSAAYALQRLR